MNTRILSKDNYPLGALLFLPQEMKEDVPLIVYLHGAGERGENLDNLYRHALPMMIQNGAEIPAIVLCPQCPAQFAWNNVVVDIKNLIDEVVAEYNIMPDRISITGSSMGGFGTWEMGFTYRNFFSAIAPVAGGGLSARCINLISTPVKAYHGTDDTVVPIVYSELMVDSAKEVGVDAELVRLPGFGHSDGIDEAYENTDLIEWLLSRRRSNFDYVPEFLEEMF